MSENAFLPIPQRLSRFLMKHCQSDMGDVNLSPLAGDASARQYYRCTKVDGSSYVLVAYPEPFDLGCFPYRQIYDLFREIDIPVPQIIAADEILGIVLQQDLGDILLQDRLKRVDQRQRKLLMRLAVDYILKIQVDGTAALKSNYIASSTALDKEKLVWELSFFHEHYLGSFRHASVRNEEQLFREYARLGSELGDFSRVLCHRDLHVRNLMVNEGIIYVIDFQDARWGPPAYDLASLLKDSVELDTLTVNELQHYYLREIRRRMPVGFSAEAFAEKAFSRQFHLCCVQRLLKALGTYGFQAAVRNKDVYVQYIDGTLRRALLSLQQIPELPEIGWLIEQELGRLDGLKHRLPH